MTRPLTFEEFLTGLRVLEERGEIKVLKWPADADDTFRASVIKVTPTTQAMLAHASHDSEHAVS